MAAGKDLTPSEYIEHHLTFFEKPVGDGGFWTINVDSLITAALLGVLALGFLWWVVRGATSAVQHVHHHYSLPLGGDRAISSRILGSALGCC